MCLWHKCPVCSSSWFVYFRCSYFVFFYSLENCPYCLDFAKNPRSMSSQKLQKKIIRENKFRWYGNTENIAEIMKYLFVFSFFVWFCLFWNTILQNVENSHPNLFIFHKAWVTFVTEVCFIKKMEVGPYGP